MAYRGDSRGDAESSRHHTGTPQGDRDSPDKPATDENHLAAIRALLVAIAKQNDTQVPLEALSAASKNGTDLIKSKKGRYERAKTVDYQLQQRPTEKTCASPNWDGVFHPFKPTELSVARHDNASSEAGWTNVLSWIMPRTAELNSAYSHFEESGYDEDGYLCALPREKSGKTIAEGPNGSDMRSPQGNGKEINEHMLIQTTESEYGTIIGQRFGREWKFGLSGLSDGKLFSIAAAQLCRDADLDESCGPNPLGSARQRLTNCFLTQFRGSWEPSKNLWGRSDHRWTGSENFDKSSWKDLVFQYHMRVFTTRPPSRSWTRPLGESIQRVSGTLQDEKNGGSLDIFEIRYSVGLKTTWELDFPAFSLVTMADAASGSLLDCGSLDDKAAWEKAGIQPSIRGTGVAAFAFRIHSLLLQWEAHWSRFIDDVGKLLNADLGNILLSARRRDMMVDTTDLKLSEFYFAVIQVLRIAAEWIQESMDDLQQLVDDVERLYLDPCPGDGFAKFLPPEIDSREVTIKVFKQNWEAVIQQQRRLGNALLARIAKKVEETKSLRDGLFNATSVNEATKSTQLNHYILVFTVATVFYLPLSFIATIFALGESFDWHDANQTTWFIIATILVAGATYLFSWLSIWIVGNPTRRQRFADAYDRLHRKAHTEWTDLRLPGG